MSEGEDSAKVIYLAVGLVMAALVLWGGWLLGTTIIHLTQIGPNGTVGLP